MSLSIDIYMEYQGLMPLRDDFLKEIILMEKIQSVGIQAVTYKGDIE